MEKKIATPAEMNEDNLFVASKNIPNTKTPGNDGLPKELSKRHIKNWRPIPLLNVDTKIVSNVFAAKLKHILPSIISSNQTAYVEKRCISKKCRLISDIMGVSGKENIPGYLVTIDLEKAFDSLDQDFILCVLKKFDLGDSFINQIKILLNGGFATQYFTAKRGAAQGDPISAYFFIMAFEVLFALIKSKVVIRGIDLQDHSFLFTAYVDESTRNVKTFEEFS